jgi:small subunit ribosomal protein S1
MANADHDDFFEEKKDLETPQEKLMKMLDEHDTVSTREPKTGEKIEGKVLSVGKDHVFVDIGAKNEAMIKRGELLDKEGELTVKPGDRVEAYVISTEEGETVLSRSLSGHKARIGELVAAMKSGLPVEGKITGINKGGFNVNIMGHRAFCPVSHIDLKYVDDPNTFLSKTLSFVITRIEERGRNIVLSRIPLLEQGLEKRLEEIEEACREGTVLAGEVTRVAKFGLFVDLGGIEGLVHVSEIAWDRTENPADSFGAGQQVECVVLKVERKERVRDTRISLSIKQVYENPWTRVSEHFSTGQVVEGTVTRLTNFGAFVQLMPGIEGLVHVSEMSWTKRVRHPSEVVSEGDTVRVTILAIDESKRSISCSLKDRSEDPWRDAEARFAPGSTVTGVVAGDTKFGFFVDLAEGVTGLLPHRNVAQEKKGEIKVGEQIEVGVENVDTENRRLSLTYGVTPSREGAETARAYMDKQEKKQKEPAAASEFGEMLKNALNKKK